MELLVGVLVGEADAADAVQGGRSAERRDLAMVGADRPLVQRCADVGPPFGAAPADPRQALLDRRVEGRPDQPELPCPVERRTLRQFGRSPVVLPDQVRMAPAVVGDDRLPGGSGDDCAAQSARDAAQVGVASDHAEVALAMPDRQLDLSAIVGRERLLDALPAVLPQQALDEGRLAGPARSPDLDDHSQIIEVRIGAYLVPDTSGRVGASAPNRRRTRAWASARGVVPWRSAASRTRRTVGPMPSTRSMTVWWSSRWSSA